MQYSEFVIGIGNSEVVFFIDDGIEIKGKYSYGMHSHRFNEIVFVLQGSCQITGQNGSFVLNKGDATLIPTDVSHSIKSDLHSYFMVVSFWIRKAEDVAFPDSFKDFTQLVAGKEPVYLKNFRCGGDFDKLIDYYYSDYLYKDQFITNCLREIMLMLLESKSTKAGALKTATLESNDYRSYIIENYMNLNFTNKANLSDLCRLLHLSTVQTQRLVKNLYNMQFREQVLFRRMEYAKNLLQNTNLSVTDIASETGYSTVQSFVAAFKGLCGITPLQYRKMIKKVQQH